MGIKVLFFGHLAEIAGTDQLELSLFGNSEEALIFIRNKFPQMRDLKFAVSVNKKLIQTTVNLKDEDTLALLPPFSGG
jgi:sulfur-carrier protein